TPAFRRRSYAGEAQATLRTPHSNGNKHTPGAQITPPIKPAAEARAQGRGQDQGPEGCGLPTGPQAYSQVSTLHALAAVWTPRVEWTRNGSAPSNIGMISLLTSPFSQTSEQYHERQKRRYGTIYQNRKQIGSGSGSISPISHVFDAEAIGAWRGPNTPLGCRRKSDLSASDVHRQHLRHMVPQANASASHNGRSSPESKATRLPTDCDTGAHTPDCDPGPASLPTISGIGSIFRDLRSGASAVLVDQAQGKAVCSLLKWGSDLPGWTPPELDFLGTNYTGSSPSALLMGILPGTITNSGHANALTECSCGAAKAPMHLVHCPRSHKRFKDLAITPANPSNVECGRTTLPDSPPVQPLWTLLNS
ncbi:hypothetical protein DID88_006738, partial [Monilinia fructigena]